jgi:hypothetical protein
MIFVERVFKFDVGDTGEKRLIFGRQGPGTTILADEPLQCGSSTTLLSPRVIVYHYGG